MPRIASMTLAGAFLTVDVSHLAEAGCDVRSSLDVVVPGLAAGTYSITVNLTGRNGVPFSPPVQNVEVDAFREESGSIQVIVATGVGESVTGTCEAYIDNAPQPSGERLIPINDCNSVSGRTQAIEVGTFLGRRFGAFATYTFPVLPDGERFSPLFLVPYPTPLVGTYATDSPQTCQALMQAWTTNVGTCDVKRWVVKMRGGSCPISTNRVFRLFNPLAVAHRYTQSEGTYVALLAQGYIGEGAAWCTPVN